MRQYLLLLLFQLLYCSSCTITQLQATLWIINRILSNWLLHSNSQPIQQLIHAIFYSTPYLYSFSSAEEIDWSFGSCLHRSLWKMEVIFWDRNNSFINKKDILSNNEFCLFHFLFLVRQHLGQVFIFILWHFVLLSIRKHLVEKWKSENCYQTKNKNKKIQSMKIKMKQICILWLRMKCIWLHHFSLTSNWQSKSVRQYPAAATVATTLLFVMHHHSTTATLWIINRILSNCHFFIQILNQFNN